MDASGGREESMACVERYPISALGEPIRATFALSGTPFEDRRIPGAEWGELKSTTPYGQMPVLTITNEDGTTTVLSQCRAILRYLGKILQYEGKPLYPSDPMLAYKCDEVMDLLEDARGKFVTTFAIKDEAEKMAARLAMVREGGGMYPILQQLDTRIGTEWCSGDSVSIADLYIVTVCNIFEGPTFLDGFPDDTFAPFPNIMALRAKLCALPPLAEYYSGKDGIYGGLATPK